MLLDYYRILVPHTMINSCCWTNRILVLQSVLASRELFE